MRADRDDTGSRAGNLYRQVHGSGPSDCFEHDVRTGAAVGLPDEIDGIPGRCGQGSVRLGKRSSLDVGFDHDHDAGSRRLGSECRELADGSTADDHGAVTGPQPGALYRSPGRRQVVGHQQGRFIGKTDGHASQRGVGMRHAHELGLCTWQRGSERGTRAEEGAVGTMPVVSFVAPGASTACREIRRHDLVAEPDALDRATDLDNLADELVPEDGAWLDAGEVATDDVEIRSADARERHAHDGVGRLQESRRRHVGHADLAARLEDYRTHGLSFGCGTAVSRGRVPKYAILHVD